MLNHYADCLALRPNKNNLISLVFLGLLLSSATGCLKGAKGLSNNSTVNTVITKQQPVHTVYRQCDYRIHGKPQRSTVFMRPGSNLVQTIHPANQARGGSAKIVTTQTLRRQKGMAPAIIPIEKIKEFTLPDPLTLEVPAHAECATCSYVQNVAHPKSLQVGEEVYLPLGSLDDAVDFDQAYATLHINSVRVLNWQSPEYSEISRITGALSPHLRNLGNDSIILVEGRFSPIHGNFEIDGQKYARDLQASEIANLITSSPVFKGMATIPTPLGINPSTFLGWNMDTKILGENSIMITIPDFTNRLVIGVGESAHSTANTPLPTSAVLNKEIDSKRFFMDFDQTINLVSQCSTVNQSSRDPSNLSSIIGKETLMGRVHLTAKEDLIVDASKVGVGFERRFSLNMSTGDITYSGIGESKVVKPPTRGGDLVQYVRYVGKMAEYLTYVRDGKGGDHKVYNSPCPDLEKAVSYLNKIYSKLKPNYLSKPLISFMNAFDFMEL